ncbi:hypothetical protein BA950_07755 [Erythrobacter sp. SAORIC-644]|nr:hypothetical protein BA950_07755 [Erythrobacter sp. SAORIC-644]
MPALYKQIARIFLLPSVLPVAAINEMRRQNACSQFAGRLEILAQVAYQYPVHWHRRGCPARIHNVVSEPI